MTQLFQFSCYESKWVFVKINKISYRFMRWEKKKEVKLTPVSMPCSSPVILPSVSVY
jgi:hypothetical protein